MRLKFKTLARSNRIPLSATTEKWQSIDERFHALETEIDPTLQPLTAAERRQLLRVGSAGESFIREFFAVLREHPETVPPMLRPAEALHDWELREKLAARRWVVLALLQRIEDTMDGLESDAYATALAGYQAIVRGGSPDGLDPIVAKLRVHFANRVTRANRTRAASRKLEQAAVAAEAEATSSAASTPSPSVPEPASPPTHNGTNHLMLVS